MPKVVGEDEFGLLLEDDVGRQFRAPRAMGGSFGAVPPPAPLDQGAPLAPPPAPTIVPPEPMELGPQPSDEPVVQPPSPPPVAAGAGAPPPADAAEPPPPAPISVPAQLEGLPGDAQGAIRGIADVRQGLAARRGELEAERAESTMRAETLAAEAGAAAEEELKASQDRARERVAGKLQGIEEQMERLRKSEIDPGRYVRNMSTGRKIAGAILLFLGGTQAPLIGRNVAMDILQKNIDRDIEAQRAQLAERNNALSRQFTLLGQLRQAGLDEQEAIRAARAMGMTAAAQKARADAARLGTKEAALRADELATEIEGQTVRELEGLRLQAEDREFAQEAKRAQLANQRRGLGLQARGLRLQERKFDAQAQADRARAIAEANAREAEAQGQRVFGVKNKATGEDFVEIPRDKDRDEIRKITDSAEFKVQAQERIRQILKRHGREAFGKAKDEAIREAAIAAQAAMANAKGTPSDRDMALYLSELGFRFNDKGEIDPLSVRDWDSVSTRIDRMEKNIERDIRNVNRRLRSYNPEWEWQPQSLPEEDEGAIAPEPSVEDLHVQLRTADAPEDRATASAALIDRAKRLGDTAEAVKFIDGQLAKVRALRTARPNDRAVIDTELNLVRQRHRLGAATRAAKAREAEKKRRRIDRIEDRTPR